jgi:hypothetical protein
MIERIMDLPEHVAGFTARGKVTSEDYDNTIIPTVEEIFRRHDKARILFHFGDEFEGYDAGAAWDDTKLGFRHWSGWEKVALVTDQDWLRHGFRALGFFMPGEVRIFAHDQLEEAKRWVAE